MLSSDDDLGKGQGQIERLRNGDMSLRFASRLQSCGLPFLACLILLHETSSLQDKWKNIISACACRVLRHNEEIDLQALRRRSY